jgi:3-phosphoglycerate kinase
VFAKKTVLDIDVNNKTVLVRVDFNVPINDMGIITDDYRLRKALPTIEHLRSSGAKVVLISHLGRPKNKNDASCSLAPIAVKLKDLLHSPVQFVSDCIGSQALKAKKSLNPGDVLLLENVRYYNEEEANDANFAKELAKGADYFVQDGFGVVHRAHASTSAITKYLPSVAGLLLKQEVETITNAIQNPDRPLAVIIGGAKISDKIDLLNIFIDKADYIAVIGAMANTFLLAEGIEVGSSLVEKDKVSQAKDILNKAYDKMRNQRFTFYIPEDVVVAKAKENNAKTRVVDIDHHTWADIQTYPKKPVKSAYTVAGDELILDIGPITASSIKGALSQSRTAIWNGTAGVTEVKGVNGAADPFSHGTRIITEGLVGTRAGEKSVPFTIVGGGDTVGYVESVSGLREQLGHVSTGGGASLELMAGYDLPGVSALIDANK